MYSQEDSLLKSSTPDLKPLRCLTHDCTCSEPTVFENYVHDLYVEDQLVELSLWDTAGAFLYCRIFWRVSVVTSDSLRTTQVRKNSTGFVLCPMRRHMSS